MKFLAIFLITLLAGGFVFKRFFSGTDSAVQLAAQNEMTKEANYQRES